MPYKDLERRKKFERERMRKWREERALNGEKGEYELQQDRLVSQIKAKKEEHQRWLGLKDDWEQRAKLEITSDKAFAEYLGVSIALMQKWRRKLLKPKKPLEERGKELEQMMRAIYDAGMNGKNSRYAQLWLEVEGHLKKEKVERVEITPEEYLRISRKLNDSLAGEFKSTGICPVCHQRSLLDEELRVSTERESAEDREVASVGVPD